MLVIGAAVGSFAVSASPAAASCTTNAIGVAHSGGRADNAYTDACAPAWGQPADAGTGRKVG
jgi:hypothetical protein